MKEQKKKIMQLLEERLAKYGFERKKTYDVFMKIVDNNIIQTIGFGSATHGEKFVRYLSPSVGVTYRDVNNIQIKLQNLEPCFPDYVGFMTGLPVGHLMPENFFIEWRFTIDDDVTEEANKMADAIIKYGLPYHEKLSNRDELIYGLEIGKYGGSREFMLPIFHYLNGNNKRALECIDEFIKKFSSDISKEEYDMLKKLAGENGEVHIANNGLKYYLEFADRFKQMLKQTEVSE